MVAGHGKDFKVSVIIPVYNAERFVRQAVESALQQSETGEVLLVEDGSPDNALAVCRTLAGEHERVKLFRHPHGENRGAAASRNLGIQHAYYEYIAFLDADDYFLPERFVATKCVFEEKPEAEGVYEAVGTYFETEQAQKNWFQHRPSAITSVTRALDPKELFKTLINGQYGYFCTDGIVLKKSIFEKIGYFDTELELSEDKVLWIKASIMAKLFAGQIERPIAMRRVHDANRCLPVDTDAKHCYYGMLRWRILLQWGIDRGLPTTQLASFFRKLSKHVGKYYAYQSVPHIKSWARVALLCPRVLFYAFYWKNLGRMLLNFGHKLFL